MRHYTTRLLETRVETEHLRELARETEARANARHATQRRSLMDRGGEHVLTFGKWRGVSIEALVEHEAAYVAWLARGDSDVCDISTSIIKAARKLLGGRCHRCGDPMANGVPVWQKLCKDCWSLTR